MVDLKAKIKLSPMKILVTGASGVCYTAKHDKK